WRCAEAARRRLALGVAARAEPAAGAEDGRPRSAVGAVLFAPASQPRRCRSRRAQARSGARCGLAGAPECSAGSRRAPMIDFGVVHLSRAQFALTALYHFLFVPLTLGLSMILVIMEATYVMTGREIWKRMTRFWGMLFGINFAMGVATGITMEFQFGTNWAYYAHYVGDIFGAPLAVEGLVAFFLEATFVGLFFFGWERLSRVGHLLVTALVALGSSLS